MLSTFREIALAMCAITLSFDTLFASTLPQDTTENSTVKVASVPQFSSWALPSGAVITPIPAEEEYSLFCLVRHGKTTMNADETIQGNSQEGSLIFTQDLLKASAMHSQSPVFDKMYSGKNGRTNLTMQIISGKIDDKSCEKDERFNEQSLGACEGRSAKEVFESAEFQNMLHDADYRMPETETSKSETGNEVTARMLEGIYDIAHENHGKTICICSSQCSMNWFYRWASGDKTKMLRIANLGTILFKYYTDRDQIQLISPEQLSFEEAYRKIKKMTAEAE